MLSFIFRSPSSQNFAELKYAPSRIEKLSNKLRLSDKLANNITIVSINSNHSKCEQNMTYE